MPSAPSDDSDADLSETGAKTDPAPSSQDGRSDFTADQTPRDLPRGPSKLTDVLTNLVIGLVCLGLSYLAWNWRLSGDRWPDSICYRTEARLVSATTDKQLKTTFTTTWSYQDRNDRSHEFVVSRDDPFTNLELTEVEAGTPTTIENYDRTKMTIEDLGDSYELRYRAPDAVVQEIKVLNRDGQQWRWSVVDDEDGYFRTTPWYWLLLKYGAFVLTFGTGASAVYLGIKAVFV